MKLLDWILEIRKKLNIPHTLKEIIDNDEKFEVMSKMALEDPSTPTNPKKLSQEDFLKLYHDSFNGKL